MQRTAPTVDRLPPSLVRHSTPCVSSRPGFTITHTMPLDRRNSQSRGLSIDPMAKSTAATNGDARLPDGTWRQAFRRRLLAWYRRAARDLPWRQECNVYHTWVSEIMLQQTQVGTVEPYFLRFIESFPTIADLAAADEQEVLRHWEGLGYYRRARQLHAAAQTIVEEFDGEFPRTAAEVQSLPGIGRYTVGAILSIAFDAREPILEANTRRLLARLLAYRGDPHRRDGEALLWTFAEELLPRRHVGELNQALMELGSLVCSPKQPSCDSCPVVELCPTAASGLQERIPPPKKPPQWESLREAAVVIHRRGRVLVRQCQKGERWSGLWDFPRFTLTAKRDDRVRVELIDKVAELVAVDIEPGEHLKTIRHGVTRFRITLECFDATALAGSTKKQNGAPLKWLRPAELDDYPLSTTGRKLGQLVQKRAATAGAK